MNTCFLPTDSDDVEIGRIDRDSDALSAVFPRTLHRCRRCRGFYVSVTSKWSTSLLPRIGLFVPDWDRTMVEPTPAPVTPPPGSIAPRPDEPLCRGTRIGWTPGECWAMWLDAKQQGRVCTCEGREPVTVFDDEADELFDHLVRTATREANRAAGRQADRDPQ